MSEPEQEKRLKLGVRKGGGKPPGYEWNVVMLSQVHDESMAFLTIEQYRHLAQQVKELARQDDPTRSEVVDVQPIESFFEIRDKGGVLQKINARVFYCTCKLNRTICVLGTLNKKNDGQTPDHIKVLMRNRGRKYNQAYCSRPSKETK
jgi:phage-related protein